MAPPTHVGKCPKCGKPISKYLLEGAPAAPKDQDKGFPAISFLCPSCKTVLGVQIDPVTVMSDTVKRLKVMLTTPAAKK